MENMPVRSRDKRMIAGVCSGLADYFKTEATYVRVGFAVAAIPFFFPVVMAYGILWLVLQEESTGTRGFDKVQAWWEENQSSRTTREQPWAGHNNQEPPMRQQPGVVFDPYNEQNPQ